MNIILCLMFLVVLVGCGADKIRIELVHDQINAYPYISEEGDYWKTPEEFYADNGGDCEDYALTKGDILAAQGHNAKLIVGHMIKGGEAHAVMLIDDRWVLDNLEDDIYSINKLRSRMRVAYASDREKNYKCVKKLQETCYPTLRHLTPCHLTFCHVAAITRNVINKTTK